MIVLSMDFNWFFSTKAYFKVCIKAQNNSVAIFYPYQSLLLSTFVLNDKYYLFNDNQLFYKFLDAYHRT